MDAIMEKLQKPFDPLEVEWRVGATNKEKTKGLALGYVTNRAIQNRLDDTFGCFGWKNEFREWHGKSQLCGISILNNGEWITKWDGADDSNIDATKGGLSDAMKRAAYQWGIGRYLYNLPDVWMPVEQRGNSYIIKGIPTLPKWALPDGFKQVPAPEIPDSETPEPTPAEPKPAGKPTTPLPPKLSDKLTAAQVNQFKQLCPTDGDKTFLKKCINDTGYDKLSDVLVIDFNRLMDLFTGTSLPFELGDKI